MAAGKKLIIKSDKVKVLAIPHYEGLRLEDLLEFAMKHSRVMQALPIEKEIKKLSRSYVANVIYTIIGDTFSQWVDKRIK